MDREGNLLFRFKEQGQSTVPEIMLFDIPQEIFKEVEKSQTTWPQISWEGTFVRRAF